MYNSSCRIHVQQNTPPPLHALRTRRDAQLRPSRVSEPHEETPVQRGAGVREMREQAGEFEHAAHDESAGIAEGKRRGRGREGTETEEACDEEATEGKENMRQKLGDWRDGY
ncbi:hypothetical protein SNOG_03181 [Parastagonospora nodorum SN15]|uniref:Uncharacterized protein n=2 Tax=Phaeosphaeria nodorum (strain SN15 / ATCC MYA-4574 / FGSC 10173) TaxID=321614 RepID=Q0UYI3_PHANO|nr:hypothetical protein SNOG_03181 [Parastagonospora nodorum SN15]EAT89912.1 hypothetical protein SNOG_03181 [Parastagonospora nodorum SN15]